MHNSYDYNIEIGHELNLKSVWEICRKDPSIHRRFREMRRTHAL
ncbi:hypothetical protein ACFLXT_05255 [Chloroflexota bacterium]